MTTTLEMLQWQVSTCMAPFLAERPDLGPDDDLLGQFALWLVAKQEADELWPYFAPML